MNIDSSRLRDEMAVFADLGTPVPQIERKGQTLVFRMFRNGDEITLGFHEFGKGKVVERCGDDRRNHASYGALLASERFGDLRRWARIQSMLLRESLADIRSDKGIEVKGSLADDHNSRLNSEQLDERLVAPQHEDSTKVMLIDGPAGIGKTKFIEMIALARADAYASRRKPLILHVQSRGRILTYLQDLIAFSLQRLRLFVTFDQLPILARHGLVTLAIDGFDELGDPNGYNNAWSQVNETVSQLRGQGTLILAGRETFIGIKRLEAALTELREQDSIDGFTLQPPSADEAKNWLRRKKWRRTDIENISDLLDTGSYALRPFFLAHLADREIASSLRESKGSNLIPILVDVMLRREAGKFGNAVDAALDEGERRQFAHRLLSETARNMADEQTEVIDEIFLAWLVEAALPKQVDPDILALLKNRAGVIAFLTTDDSPSNRRFAHTQLLNYFLSTAAIDALENDDVPKFVRRNVLSADFLGVFVDVFQHVARTKPERCWRFFRRATELAGNYQSIDRGARNLGAWLIAALPTMADIADAGDVLQLGRLDVDETIMRGTLGRSTIRSVAVNQLDIRATDLGESTFESCTVNTAIVDGGTRVSPSFPIPQRLRLQNGDTTYDDMWDPAEIRDWLDNRGHKPADIRQPIRSMRHEMMLRLLERACRSSSFWIPEETKTRVDRFVNDPVWPEVLEVLDHHGFIRERKLAVSGPNSRFVHIRQPERILAHDPDDGEVEKLYEALVDAAR